MAIEIPTQQKSEAKKNAEEKEVVLNAVAELENPTKKIIDKIRSRIENGEYGLIIGDDASGRIPAIILGNFIKRVSEIKGVPKPNIIFIPGKLGKDMPQELFFKRNRRKHLEEHISKWGADKNKRILIVTDTIETGRSLATLVYSLSELGYSVDVATIGLGLFNEDKRLQNINLKGVEIFSGEYREPDSYDHTPGIYRQHLLGGVDKNPGDEKSRSVKKSEIDPLAKEDVQDYINLARKDAGIVVDHLMEWYASLENNEK